MASPKVIYKLIDISSEGKHEEMIERASTPLPRDTFPNIRVILEISHSSVEANADHEKDLNSSLDSIDTNCKRIKLSNSFESVESGEYPDSSEDNEAGEIIESPECPDEQLEEYEPNNMTNSEVYVVEVHKRTSTQSVTSEVIADYLEQVANEDAASYFVTPPGPLKKINTKAVSPLNDLEERRAVTASPTKPGMKNSYGRYSSPSSFQARLPGYALSQSAPGLECGCRRFGYGRGHGCTAKLSKRYFGF